jgi:hypothetical protein
LNCVFQSKIKGITDKGMPDRDLQEARDVFVKVMQVVKV